MSIDLEVEIDVEDTTYLVKVKEFSAPDNHDEYTTGELVTPDTVTHHQSDGPCQKSWASFVWHYQMANGWQTFGDAERQIENVLFSTLMQRLQDHYDRD